MSIASHHGRNGARETGRLWPMSAFTSTFVWQESVATPGYLSVEVREKESTLEKSGWKNRQLGA